MEPCRKRHVKQKQDECGNRQRRLSSFIPTHRSKCDRLRPSKMQQVPRHKSSQKHTNNPFLFRGTGKKTNSISIWRAATSVTEAESLEETWEPPSAFHTVFLPLSPALISVIIALPVIQWGSETEERGGYIQK